MSDDFKGGGENEMEFLNEVQRQRTNCAWSFQHDYIMCEDVHTTELEQAEHLWLKSII